ncbi:MAG: 16S rRNA (uracil(1498)-N(3))-methyltransferase [Candidatus Saganbacteria bacterium]|nr:16S rRNA (uracil(1498)-N(3))-methyltransferase [Candidatus Saganbacteria bacterium]
MHRFFIPKDQLPNIFGTDAHHIKNVLRSKVGDKLELCDNTGNIYNSKIHEIKRDEIICNIISTHKEDQLPVKVTIAQGLPKAKKMDFIIQKAAELGADQIIPTLCERSINRADKHNRWQKIAKEAAQQSKASKLPTILPLTKFSDVLKLAVDYDLAIIPWEEEKVTSLKQVLAKTQKHSNTETILVLIGPEGGFSKDEVAQACAAGFITISLGRQILRTETAALALLSMLNYEYNL